MKNEPPPRSNRLKITVFAFLFAACFLLILSGCHNPLRHDHASLGAAGGGDGTGSFSLTVGRQNAAVAEMAARTILPVAPDGFDRYYLKFTPCDTCVQGNTAPDRKRWEGGDIVLPEGIWNLQVSAYLGYYQTDDGGQGEARKAASGDLLGIAVQSGAALAGSVTLYPVSDGYGTFRWNINLVDVSLLSGSMHITRIDEHDGEPFLPQTISLDMDTLYGGSGLSLPAGRYDVVLRLYNEREDWVTISDVLHIYRSLESVFDLTFERRHFRTPLLQALLDTWDGAEWNLYQAGIRAGHFALLGIPGVYDRYFEKLINGFNALSTSGPYPFVPFNLEGLQDFVLEALWYDPDLDADVTVSRFGGDVERFGNLAAAFAWLRAYAQGGGPYIVDITADQSISAADALLPERALEIIMHGNTSMRTVMLDGQGSLFVVPGGVSLHLGNITLHGIQENNAPLLSVQGGGSLYLTGGARITGNSNAGDADRWPYLGGGVRVAGTVIMAGGEIFGNTAVNSGGGGVVVADGGSFTMTGGSIRSNTVQAWGGGGVFIAGDSTFTMGGTAAIHNNDAFNSGGGGVLVGNGGTFLMNHGQIAHNHARGGGGGGVNVGDGWADSYYDTGAPGVFSMLDGTIANNTATGSGGGVFAGGNFAMSGGMLTRNRALGNSSLGGGVYVNGSVFTMYGGTISLNEAREYRGGGGVFIANRVRQSDTFSGVLNMHNNSVISGNSASNGGGVYVGTGGILSLYDNAAISDNTATADGGGVFISGGSFFLRSGTVSANTAARGGGVYVGYEGHFAMYGGMVDGTAPLGASLFVYDYGTARYGGDLAALGPLGTANYPLPAIPDAGLSVSVDGGPARHYSNLSAVFASITEAPGDYYVITLFSPQNLVNWTLQSGQHITLRGWDEVRGVITHIGAADTSMFNIGNEYLNQRVSLTLGNNITLRGRSDGTSGTVPSFLIGSNGTLTMLDGSVITAHVTEGQVRPIDVFGASARLDIRGGSITGNNNIDQDFAHAAVILNNGTLTMSGGSITGNNTHAPGRSADVFMSTNPAVTATLSGTAGIGVIRLSPTDVSTPYGSTRVALGADGWAGSIGRLDLAHDVVTATAVEEHWDGRIVLSGDGLTAVAVANVALGYFVPQTAPAFSQRISGFALSVALSASGDEIVKLAPAP